MIEPKQLSCDWDQLPPLSSRYVWLASQNFQSGEQIFYNLHNPLSHYRCRIPELLGRRIRANFHGWVILSSYPRVVMWSLWNPLTSKLIRLPPLNHEHWDSHMCCLSAPVDDPTAIFLLTTNDKPTIVFCRLDRKRKRLKWTEMSYANQVKSMSYADQGCVLECPTCCNGKVYALTRGAYEEVIVQIDIVVKDKEVVITLLPFLVVPYPCFSRFLPFDGGTSFLPSLKGTCTELFFILVDFKGKTSTTVCDVFLSKLDMTSMRWEEIQDLKDAIFFVELVSGYSVFYKSAVAPELGGFVHILGEMGKVIYSYHIKDRTISPSLMPCVVRESQAWAMLEFSTKGDHADSKQREDDRDIGIDVRLVERNDEIVSNSTTTVESPMLDISFHLLEKIMDHCVGVEYMNFHTTCKHCHLAAPPIQNITTLKRLQMYSLVSPLLMVMDKEGVITFIDSMGGDRYFLRTSWEPIAHHHIYCFRYGWLLMYNIGSGSPVFFNPFTNALCKLPMIFCIDRFCLSAAPTSPDMHFVAQEQSWRRFTLNFGGDDPYSCQFLTFYGCDLYALSNEGGIGVFRQRGKVMYSDHIKDRTISQFSMPCVVRESQVWAMLECRLEGDHADDSKHREEGKDNGMDVRLVRDDEIISNYTTGESPLLDIPFHLLEKIMEHCLGIEYMNFRTTCKHCHLAAPPIKWRSNKTTLRRLQMYSLVSPWLMVLDNEGVITCIDPMGGDRYFLTTSRELIANHHIYCSRYGWLLMYKLGAGSPVFYNPFTNVLCKLPRIFRIDMFCFSAPPTSPDCMVVGFSTSEEWEEEWEVYIHYVAREQSWRKFILNFGGDDPYSFQFPTFYGRDLYALSKDGGIGIFRQMGEEDYSLELLVSKAPVTWCGSQVKYYLANCDQHILLVILGEFGELVEVFNLNDSKSAWEKIDGIGKHMVYISNTTCFCMKAKLPEMENKIYFTRLSHTGNGKVVFYSLETCRFHTFNCKNIEEGLEDLFRTISYCYPHAWIEPSWS